MKITKEQENLITNVKKKIKTECKFILSAAYSHDAAIGKVIDQVMGIGCISGSILINSYYKLPKEQSDFDIFLKYDENLFTKIKNVLDKKVQNLEIKEWGDDVYSVVGASHSVKFDLGNLSPIQINIIFVENLYNFEKLTSQFDFEVCNWFYEWKADSLYISEECLVCLEKHELDYTYERNKYLKNKVSKFKQEMNFGAILDETFFESEINRLKKYVNLKRFVLSTKMMETIKEINTNCVEIWKI